MDRQTWQTYEWSPWRLLWLWAHSGYRSRRELAGQIGMSDRSLDRWMSGEFKPTPSARVLLGLTAERLGLGEKMLALPVEGTKEQLYSID